MQCQDEEGNWRRPESRPSMEQNGIKTEPKTPGDLLCPKNENYLFVLQVEQTIRGEIELLKEMWSSRDFHVNLVKFINSEKCLEFQKPAN